MHKIIDTALRDFTAIGSSVISLVFVVLAYTSGMISMANHMFIGIIIVIAVSSLLKMFFFTERPRKEHYTNLLEKIDAGSFPSVHVARVTVLAMMWWFTTPSTFVTVVGVILVLSIAATRIILRKHRVRDVIGGAILGFIVSSLVQYLL